MRLSVATVILCTIAIIGAGCAAGVETVTATDPAVQWPPAPQKARIQYLQSISTPADANVRRGFVSSAWRFFKGSQAERITQPLGIHVDSSGRLYVADAGQKKVHVFDRRNSRYYSFPQKPVEGLQSLVGVVASNDGRVYVSDSTTKLIHIFEDFGRVYSGSADIGGLGRPTDLALRGGDKELLIVDTVNGEIVGLDTQDLSILWRVGRDGSTQDAFHFPISVAVSGNGSIYVSDSLNFRIQMLDPNLGFLGAFGQVGDSPGYFSRPKGVAVDSDGNIYVVDALFDNVQIFNTDGELLLNFGDSGQGPGEFWLPSDIYIDELDRIYVSDSHNSRVQVFQYIGEDEQS